MENHESIPNISVVWRGKKFSIEMSSDATLKELGLKLQKLTDVRADTMRLIVPKYSNKTSKLVSPFSNDQAFLSLEETSVTKVKSIRMMGVPETEVDEVLQSAKADLRIAGFEEEEKRLRQRMSDRPQASLKLPQGPYIFCDFRTLEIPGIELNPPASQALKRMHMLAADPGIVAIMNKHRWRIGIMTEMAPIGYVGVSPKCILGFNKNHGEEISMRLRTDDLKGFRKYESIKKTLLHELAHMVYSEHDANFYALDKQLNQEAASLDWTRSRSQTLNGVQNLEHYEEDLFNGDSGNSTWKLGGNTLDQLASARASSVAAAYRRLANASMNSLGGSVVNEEPDPDDSGFNTLEQTASMELIEKENLDICNPNKAERKPAYEPDPDDHSGNLNKLEPDPDDHSVDQDMLEPDPDDHSGDQDMLEPDPDDNSGDQVKLEPDTDDHSGDQDKLEPDPDDHSGDQDKLEPDPDDHSGNQISIEPDPDDSHGGESLESSFHPEFTRSRIILGQNSMDSWSMQLLPPSETGRKLGIIKLDAEPDPDEVLEVEIVDSEIQTRKNVEEPDPDDSLVNGVLQAEPDPDDNLVHQLGMSGTRTHEPDPDDQELQRIQDPVTVVCSRLQKAIEMLQVGLKPAEATAAVQTLFKIIRNVIEHPDEMKYRRLRKANPVIKRNVASYQAAMEILSLIGFNEDVLLDEIGKAETYLVLKRNDPGLLWLAKSSLETCIA